MFVCLDVYVKGLKWPRIVVLSSVYESGKVWTFGHVYSNWLCFKLITLTTDKPWLLPLSSLILFSSSFPKSACPTQAVRCFNVFADFQSFFQSENLGFALSDEGGVRGYEYRNTAHGSMKIRQYRIKIWPIPKPQLQMGKSWCCQYFKSSFQIEIILLCQCFQI